MRDPPEPDQLEAPDTTVAPDDARWLNGVNRQMQPDAPSQRVAASQRAAEKRKANAMRPDERAAKRLADQQRRRATQREHETATAGSVTGAVREASEFDAALEHVARDAGLKTLEKHDFHDWLLDVVLLPDEESLSEWRGSEAYERSKHERIAAFCTCFSRPDGGQRTWIMPYGEAWACGGRHEKPAERLARVVGCASAC